MKIVESCLHSRRTIAFYGIASELAYLLRRIAAALEKEP